MKCGLALSWSLRLRARVQKHICNSLCCAVLCCAVLCCAVLCCAAAESSWAQSYVIARDDNGSHRVTHRRVAGTNASYSSAYRRSMRPYNLLRGQHVPSAHNTSWGQHHSTTHRDIALRSVLCDPMATQPLVLTTCVTSRRTRRPHSITTYTLEPLPAQHAALEQHLRDTGRAPVANLTPFPLAPLSSTRPISSHSSFWPLAPPVSRQRARATAQHAAAWRRQVADMTAHLPHCSPACAQLVHSSVGLAAQPRVRGPSIAPPKPLSPPGGQVLVSGGRECESQHGRQ
jgi:hypothetical protein